MNTPNNPQRSSESKETTGNPETRREFIQKMALGYAGMLLASGCALNPDERTAVEDCAEVNKFLGGTGVLIYPFGTFPIFPARVLNAENQVCARFRGQSDKTWVVYYNESGTDPGDEIELSIEIVKTFQTAREAAEFLKGKYGTKKPTAEAVSKTDEPQNNREKSSTTH